MLAAAGLTRLGLADRITQRLPTEKIYPAVGQGALGLEARADDPPIHRAARLLDDPATHQAVLAERALLAALRGGCLAPVGAWGRTHGEDVLRLDAVVLDPTGRQRITVTVQGSPADAADLGRQAATELLGQGAAQLIAASRNP